MTILLSTLLSKTNLINKLALMNKEEFNIDPNISDEIIESSNTTMSLPNSNMMSNNDNITTTLSPQRRMFESQEQTVNQQKRDNEKLNTKNCYDPKILEFKAYLKEIYEMKEPDSWQNITPEKAFGFMFYQANRAKKKGRKQVGQFDKADYDKTMRCTEDKLINVLGRQAINQYLCAICKLVQEQFEKGLIQYRKEDIMTSSMKNLIDVVNTRGERVLKKISKKEQQMISSPIEF